MACQFNVTLLLRRLESSHMWQWWQMGNYPLTHYWEYIFIDSYWLLQISNNE